MLRMLTSSRCASPDAALLRLCGCPAAGAEVLHTVRARQAVRERELQQPRRPRSPRLCQQQGKAASAPRQRCDATLQYTRRCLVLVMLHAQYVEGQLKRAKAIKNRMLLGNELPRIVYPLAEVACKVATCHRSFASISWPHLQRLGRCPILGCEGRQQ